MKKKTRKISVENNKKRVKNSIEKDILENREYKSAEDIKLDVIKPKKKLFSNKINNLKIKYKKDPKKFALVLSSLLLALSLLCGSSYAYFTYIGKTDNTTLIEAGTLALTFKNESNAIILDNALPQKDSDALENNTEYEFAIKNNGSLSANYTITLDNTCTTRKTYTINETEITPDKCIPNEYIKVGIKEGDNDYKVVEVNEEGNIVIEADKINKSKTKSYKMKIWLSYDTPNEYNSLETQNIIYSGKLGLEYEQGLEPIPPEASIIVTNNLDSTQTATLTGTTSKGVEAYYFGTNASPNSSDYTTLETETTEFSKEVTVNTDGTYYLFVKSKTGNISDPATINLYKTILEAGEGTAEPAYVFTEENKSFTVPEATFDTEEFLGWSPTENASVSDSWVDSESQFEVTKNSTLYAQSYDVDTLEKTISGSVRSGDIKLSSPTTLASTTIAATNIKDISVSPAIDSGYSSIGGLPYWYTNHASARPHKAILLSWGEPFSVRNFNSSAITVAPKVSTLEVYQRTGTISEGSIDDRISSMQNIADACLSYKIADGDLIINSKSQNVSVGAKSYASTSTISPPTGYRNICLAGWDMDQVSGALYNIHAIGAYTSQLQVSNLGTSSATVAISTWELQERIKSEGTRTTPTYDSYETSAQMRLAALENLSSKSESFFNYSNCYTVNPYFNGNITVSDTGAPASTLAISGYDRIVCPTGFSNHNMSSGSANSFVDVKALRLSSYTSDSSATIYYQYSGGYYGSSYRYPTNCSAYINMFVINK